MFIKCPNCSIVHSFDDDIVQEGIKCSSCGFKLNPSWGVTSDYSKEQSDDGELYSLSNVLVDMEKADIIARAQLINIFYNTLDDSISESSKVLLVAEEFYPSEYEEDDWW